MLNHSLLIEGVRLGVEQFDDEFGRVGDDRRDFVVRVALVLAENGDDGRDSGDDNDDVDNNETGYKTWCK